MTRLIRRTEQEVREELEALYTAHPALRTHRRTCCGGCAEQDLAAEHGWGSPTVANWDRVEALRFLLGDDR